MAKKKINSAGPVCCPNGHSKCWGLSVLVLGILILLNALFGWFSWGVFIGGIVALKGIGILLHSRFCK